MEENKQTENKTEQTENKQKEQYKDFVSKEEFTTWKKSQEELVVKIKEELQLKTDALKIKDQMISEFKDMITIKPKENTDEEDNLNFNDLI